MEKSLEERIKKILEQCTPEENKKLQAKVESRKSSDEPFIKEYKNILKKRREAIYRNENNYREGDSSLSEEHVAQAMLLENLISDEDLDSVVLEEAEEYVKSLIFKMKKSILSSVEMELYIINSVLDLFQRQGYSEHTLERIEQITMEELERLKKAQGK
ncbi:MAG: hypothetical protein J6B11_09480 [Spirochaetales bacterium]|nr:hypothetical protein [Spirochaetales bacterium]